MSCASVFSRGLVVLVAFSTTRPCACVTEQAHEYFVPRVTGCFSVRR